MANLTNACKECDKCSPSCEGLLFPNFVDEHHEKVISSTEESKQPIPLCMFCDKKSAECAYGELRGSISCLDLLHPHI